MLFDVTTLGEIMLRLSTPAGTRLETAAALDLHPGGAEANLAALLARLGRQSAWLGALPANALGRLAASHLVAAGVDLAGVHWCAEGRMGTYYVEFSAPPRPAQVIYDRAGSCMALLTPDEVDWERLLQTRLLHLTGITPALSPGCREVVASAAARARAAGVPVSFDVNYRQKLWDPQTAAAALEPLLRMADIVFCSHADAQRLFGCPSDGPAALRRLAEHPAIAAAQLVVMSIGSRGVLASLAGELLEVDALPVTIVDRLGAGDALAAGVLHGWLDGDVPRGLRMGVTLAALALAQHGDLLITTPQELAMLLDTAPGLIMR